MENEEKYTELLNNIPQEILEKFLKNKRAEKDENVIVLNKNNVLRFYIENEEGKTGDYLEFDMEDIELPLKYADLLEQDKQNKKWLRDEQLIIDKRQDVQVKGQAISKNTMDKFKALETFFKKEKDIYNIFLGENGVEKLLNGRKLGWTSLDEIDEIIEKQILPHLDLSLKGISNKIKDKYGSALEKEKKVMEIDD